MNMLDHLALEALSCSIPVLVRNIPVYETWLVDGRDVYKANNFETFLKKAKAILQGTAPNLISAGREVAEERSLDKIGDKLLEIEKQLMKK